MAGKQIGRTRLRSFSQMTEEEAGVEILDMKRMGWRRRLFRTLSPPFVPAPRGQPYRGEDTFLEILDFAENRLKARTAIVEPYVSTDWNAEYSAIYSRVFYDVPRLARRVHFFRAAGMSVRPKHLLSMPKRLRDAYLGYTVVRPLQAFRVGDTVLSPPCIVAKPPRQLVHCVTEFGVSLLGNRLAVVGMPFLQQETTVGVCAEADLWMMARYLNNKGETRRYRPPQITELATTAFTVGPPRDGLVPVQMLDAIRQMGLHPVVVPGRRHDETRRFINICVESGLPVIAGIPGHVVVVVGHVYNTPIGLTDEMATMSDAVDSFIAHDDAIGPYRRMAVGTEQIDVPGHGSITLMSLDGKRVDFCLTAFPRRVNKDCEDVLETAKLWLEQIRKQIADRVSEVHVSDLWPSDDLGDLVLRIYLRLSSSFKADLLTPVPSKRRIAAVIHRYLCTPMPKYVWVVELAKRRGLAESTPHDRRIHGEIVFDSTGNRHLPEETLLAFHYDGVMYVPPTASKNAKLLVTRARPYLPLERPAV